MSRWVTTRPPRAWSPRDPRTCAPGACAPRCWRGRRAMTPCRRCTPSCRLAIAASPIHPGACCWGAWPNSSSARPRRWTGTAGWPAGRNGRKRGSGSPWPCTNWVASSRPTPRPTPCRTTPTVMATHAATPTCWRASCASAAAMRPAKSRRWTGAWPPGRTIRRCCTPAHWPGSARTGSIVPRPTCASCWSPSRTTWLRSTRSATPWPTAPSATRRRWN